MERLLEDFPMLFKRLGIHQHTGNLVDLEITDDLTQNDVCVEGGNFLPKDKTLKRKMQTLLNIYNYTSTVIIFSHQYKRIWTFEANVTIDCTDYIYSACKGIVYHITKNENVGSILAKGLLPRKKEYGKRYGYRNFDERIFFIYCKKKELQDAIKELADSLAIGAIREVDDFSLLVVDLKEMGKRIKFFYDPVYSTNTKFHPCYTKEYIPPQCIEVFPLKDFIS